MQALNIFRPFSHEKDLLHVPTARLLDFLNEPEDVYWEEPIGKSPRYRIICNSHWVHSASVGLRCRRQFSPMKR